MGMGLIGMEQNDRQPEKTVLGFSGCLSFVYRNRKLVYTRPRLEQTRVRAFLISKAA